VVGRAIRATMLHEMARVMSSHSSMGLVLTHHRLPFLLSRQ